MAKRIRVRLIHLYGGVSISVAAAAVVEVVVEVGGWWWRWVGGARG